MSSFQDVQANGEDQGEGEAVEEDADSMNGVVFVNGNQDEELDKNDETTSSP